MIDRSETPTVPAPDSEWEQAFEAEIARLGGTWSQCRQVKPIREES